MQPRRPGAAAAFGTTFAVTVAAQPAAMILGSLLGDYFFNAWFYMVIAVPFFAATGVPAGVLGALGTLILRRVDRRASPRALLPAAFGHGFGVFVLVGVTHLYWADHPPTPVIVAVAVISGVAAGILTTYLALATSAVDDAPDQE
jgi:hypothetical protein